MVQSMKTPFEMPSIMRNNSEHQKDNNFHDFYIKLVMQGQFYDCLYAAVHQSMRKCQWRPHCYKQEHHLPQHRTEEDLEKLPVSYGKKFSQSAHVNKLLLKKQRNMDMN